MAKIGIVAPYSDTSGTGTFARNLARGLTSDGQHRVYVFSFNEPWEMTSEDEGIELFEFGPLNPGNIWELGEFAANHATNEAIDLLAPQCKPELGVAAIIAKSLAAERGHHLPACANWHSNFGWIKDAPYHLALSRICAAHLDSILPVSRNVQDDLNELTGRDTPRRIVPSGGVNVEKVASYPRDRSVFAPYFPADGFVLTFVGRLLHNKGLDLLARALQLLEDDDVFALIVGKGPFLDVFQEAARDAGVSDRMKFAGFLSDDQVYTVLNSADAFVLPSRWESFNISALEAMAASLPVIGTRVGGFPDWVGDNACLVAPESPEELARAIQTLRQDATYREALARKGAALATRYDWRNIGKGSALEYQSLLSGPTRTLPPLELSPDRLEVDTRAGRIVFDREGYVAGPSMHAEFPSKESPSKESPSKESPSKESSKKSRDASSTQESARYRITTFGLFHPSEALEAEQGAVVDRERLYHERRDPS